MSKFMRGTSGYGYLGMFSSKKSQINKIYKRNLFPI